MSTNHLDWELIDKLAEELDVEYWARRKWRQRQHVPHRWRLAIIASAKGRIKPEHFYAMDRKQKRNAA